LGEPFDPAPIQLDDRPAAEADRFERRHNPSRRRGRGRFHPLMLGARSIANVLKCTTDAVAQRRIAAIGSPPPCW
jgi:hypothetical protein